MRFINHANACIFQMKILLQNINIHTFQILEIETLGLK
jgi:hypothetical protein